MDERGSTAPPRDLDDLRSLREQVRMLSAQFSGLASRMQRFEQIQESLADEFLKVLRRLPEVSDG